MGKSQKVYSLEILHHIYISAFEIFEFSLANSVCNYSTKQQIMETQVHVDWWKENNTFKLLVEFNRI